MSSSHGPPETPGTTAPRSNHEKPASTTKTDNWGELLEANARPSEGLRILTLASDVPLFSCLSAIRQIDAQHGGRISVSAVCTDAITDPAARIAAKRRMWRFYSAEQRAQSYERTKGFCAENAIDFYSGSIKAPLFADLLQRWQPDIVLSAFFGQLIPSEVIRAPRLGIYNVHPSDTVRGVRGIDPFTDTIKAGLRQPNGEFGEVVVHQVNESFDGGQVVMTTPGLPFHDRDGVIPANPIHIGFKFCLYVYPILVYTLLERILETGRTCDHAEVQFSDAVLEKMNGYRYANTIGFTPAEELLQEMQEVIRANSRAA